MSSIADRIGQLSPERIRQLARAIDLKKMRSPEPPLQRHPGRSEYPLSCAQERLWFLDQLVPGNVAYNWPFAFRWTIALDPDVCRRTIAAIAARHEILRTTYASVDGAPVQRVAPAGDVPWRLIDLRHLAPHEAEREAAQRIAEDARTPFDLARGPLARYTFFQLGPREAILAGTLHHSVVDAWSRKVWIEEFGAIFTALARGGAPQLPDLPVQYGDCAVWERAWLQHEAGARQLAYWKRQLRDIPVLDLPTDYPRPAVKSFRGASEPVSLSKALTEQLRALSRQESSSLFMTLLAAFHTLLFRYTGQADVPVAMPSANRNRVELERLIGFFVNTLVARVDLSGNPTFRELLHRVRGVCVDAYAHQRAPFERLVEELQPKRDPARSPLAQVVFQLEDIPKAAGTAGGGAGTAIKPIDVDAGTTTFDVNVHLYEAWDSGVIERPEGIRGTFAYSLDLFRPETIRRLCGHYTTLLESIASDPDRRIGGLSLLSEGERRTFTGWNSTARDYPGEPTVMQRFERQVARTPDAFAVVAGDRQLTYAALNARANRLAHRLRELGVGPDVRVAIAIGRSVDIAVAIMGVLKAGGAYVPLDPEHPDERLRVTVADAGARVIVTEASAVDRFGADRATPVICLDRASDLAADAFDPEPLAAPENLAYVVYTSGSTGAPKGVAIEHRNLTNYVDAMSRRCGFRDGLSFAVASTFAADLVNTAVYPALCRGGALHILSRDVASDATRLAQYLRANAIDCLKMTPSHLAVLVDGERSECRIAAEWFVLGGEPLSRDWAGHVRRSRDVRIVNHYGPTEVTIGGVTCEAGDESHASAGETVPIGTPLDNVSTYVVDAHLELVPVGVTGDLYIGGKGVGRGYIQRAGATAERFVADPFAGVPGARMYRTGDRVRQLADGNLVFLGRDDDQVKVRGYRIELAEIEAVLARHPSIREAAVVTRGEGADKQLVAHLVWRDDADRDVSELKTRLKQTLPEYMLPARFVALESLPRLGNGKIDRQRLRAGGADSDTIDVGYVAPRDAVEHRLAQIWEQAIAIPRVGVHDNFFDIGGHSLLAVRVVAQIQDAFGRAVPLATLFAKPTINELAKLLRGGAAGQLSPLVTLRATGTRTPVFLIHPAGGSVVCYYELARHLGPDRPVYALQFQGFAEAATRNISIPEMAAHYLRTIRAVRPQGPYTFGGWSAGGVVALEMARQVAAEGDPAPLVLVLDMRAPVSATPAADTLARSRAESLLSLAHRLQLYTGRPFDVSSDALIGLSPDEQLDFFVAEMQRRQLIPSEVPATAWLRDFLAIYENNATAVRAYAPGSHAGPVVLFRGREALPEIEREFADLYRDPTLGWQSICSQRVTVHRVPGHHMSMVAAPHATDLARTIVDTLDTFEASWSVA